MLYSSDFNAKIVSIITGVYIFLVAFIGFGGKKMKGKGEGKKGREKRKGKKDGKRGS